jgi:hypothetical protein
MFCFSPLTPISMVTECKSDLAHFSILRLIQNPNATTGFEPTSFKRALLSIFYVPLHTFLHNLLNVLAQIADKMGLQ